MDDEGHLLLFACRHTEVKAKAFAVGIVEADVGEGFGGGEAYRLVVVDGVVDVAHAEGVRGLVPIGVQVACRLFLAHAQHQLVHHVELHLPNVVAAVDDAYLIVLLGLVDRHEDSHGDGHVVVFGVEGRPALTVSCGGRHKLVLVDEQHLAGVVAHDVVAPASEFELLCVVSEGESGHGAADDASEVLLVGQHVDPGHGRVGVGDHVVAMPVAFFRVCLVAVTPSFVEASVLVVELKVAPHAEVAFRLQHGIFYLVLVVLVGHFEAAQLLCNGDAVFGGEGQPCHGVEQGAFFGCDVIAVEHVHLAVVDVLCPQVFGAGHAIAFVGRCVVDEHQVEQQSVHLVVFEGAEHLLGVAGVVHAVHFHKEYGQVAADAEAPEGVLRQRVVLQQLVAVVAEGGCLGHIFGHAAVEAHLAAFEQREAGAHVVVHRCGAEGMLHIHRVLVLHGELQQCIAALAIARKDEGFHLLAVGDVQSAAHAHDGVEGGAYGRRQGAAALDDVGMTQAVSSSEELEARGLVLQHRRPVRLLFGVCRFGDPQLVQHVVAHAAVAGAVEDESLVVGVVFRRHLHAGEDAVVLVLGGAIQHHLAV